MQWHEANPIPQECCNCKKEDCYNCEIAGQRWILSREDKLRNDRMLKARAIARLKRQIANIDKELLPFTPEQKAALDGHRIMTYDLFWECLQVCFTADNMEMYMKIWNDYPEHVQTVIDHRDSQDKADP